MGELEKEFVPYEIALDMKSIGFNEPCFSIYYSKDKSFSWHHYKDHTNDEPALDTGEFNISAPTYSAAFRWFREKYGLMHIINPYYFTAEIDYLNERIVNKQYGDFIPHDHLVDEEGEEIKHSSYKEAEQACLDKLIEICKTKNNEQAN